MDSFHIDKTGEAGRKNIMNSFRIDLLYNTPKAGGEGIVKGTYASVVSDGRSSPCGGRRIVLIIATVMPNSQSKGPGSEIHAYPGDGDYVEGLTE